MADSGGDDFEEDLVGLGDLGADGDEVELDLGLVEGECEVGFGCRHFVLCKKSLYDDRDKSVCGDVVIRRRVKPLGKYEIQETGSYI